jgi:predicted RNA polymerase sigma factor
LPECDLRPDAEPVTPTIVIGVDAITVRAPTRRNTMFDALTRWPTDGAPERPKPFLTTARQEDRRGN